MLQKQVLLAIGSGNTFFLVALLVAHFCCLQPPPRAGCVADILGGEESLGWSWAGWRGVGDGLPQGVFFCAAAGSWSSGGCQGCRE